MIALAHRFVRVRAHGWIGYFKVAWNWLDFALAMAAGCPRRLLGPCMAFFRGLLLVWSP